MSPAQPVGVPLPADGTLPAPAVELPPLSAYVHVPFCAVRCGYCDFNTYTTGFGPGADRATYDRSVIDEIRWARQVFKRSGYPARPFHSIFCGGGTPTMLSASSLVGIVSELRTQFGCEPGCEITTEANPDSVDRDYLAELVAGGFTRV